LRAHVHTTAGSLTASERRIASLAGGTDKLRPRAGAVGYAEDGRDASLGDAEQALDAIRAGRLLGSAVLKVAER
jgi:hypothetical protein